MSKAFDELKSLIEKYYLEAHPLQKGNQAFKINEYPDMTGKELFQLEALFYNKRQERPLNQYFNPAIYSENIVRSFDSFSIDHYITIISIPFHEPVIRMTENEIAKKLKDSKSRNLNIESGKEDISQNFLVQLADIDKRSLIAFY